MRADHSLESHGEEALDTECVSALTWKQPWQKSREILDRWRHSGHHEPMSLLASSLLETHQEPGIWVDASTLVAGPRRPLTETLMLQGRCRGALLADWAENFSAQWGREVPALIRQGLGELGDGLADAPSSVAWYPVATQLRMTEILLDEVVEGRVDALRQALLTLVDAQRAARFLARRMGLKRLVSHVGTLFSQCYDRGQTEVQVSKGYGVVTMAGADMVTHPTWQLLQLVGFEVLSELAAEPHAQVSGRIGSGRLFEVHVRW